MGRGGDVWPGWWWFIIGLVAMLGMSLSAHSPAADADGLAPGNGPHTLRTYVAK